MYRATRDGFTAADFWRCCAGKGPTLTLIKVGSPQTVLCHCDCAAVVFFCAVDSSIDSARRCASVGVQVAGNGFVCGAYTPLSWPADAATHRGHVADPSGRTFLFSLVNAHGRPGKLRLKDSHREKALNFRGSGYGPGFGSGADLRLMWNANSASHVQGCSAQQNSFKLDQEADADAGLPPIRFASDKTLLAGDDGRGQVFCDFAAVEIEVYQL